MGRKKMNVKNMTVKQLRTLLKELHFGGLGVKDIMLVYDIEEELQARGKL
jgi:hypothetical protein